MPLPIILIIIFEAALFIIERVAIRAALAYVGSKFLEFMRPKLLAWAEEYAPVFVQYTINEALGIELQIPLTPQSLTTAFNQKMGLDGVFALTDITSKEAIRLDGERIAAHFLSEALPGLNRKRLRFTPGYREDLKACLLAEIRRQIRTGMDQGESTLLPAAAVARIFEIGQAGYEYTPHVNIDSPMNQAGREQAKWCREHMTKTWELA